MKSSKLIVMAAALLGWQTSNASVIEIQFNATVDHVGSFLAGDGIDIGDSVTGIFSYDTAATDSSLADVNNGFYPGINFSLTIDGITLSSSTPSIHVQNDQQNGSATNPADGMTVGDGIDSGSLMLNGYEATGFQFGLRRDNVTVGQLWGDDHLPDQADWANITLADINAPDWHWLAFNVPGGIGINDDIRWEINSFTARDTSIPEPSVIMLMCLSLVGMCYVRRRQA